MRLAPRLAAVIAIALAAPAARAQLKVGYVDSQRAVYEVEEGKALTASLKKELDDRQKVASQRVEEVRKLEEDFSRQSLIMTPEAKAAKTAELDRKKMEVQELIVKLQQELSGKEGEAMRPLEAKFLSVIREVAEGEGISVVLDKRGVLYAPGSLDLTNQVIRKYNEKFPVSARKAEAPKKPDAAAPAKK
jgi:outer membrane protein